MLQNIDHQNPVKRVVFKGKLEGVAGGGVKAGTLLGLFEGLVADVGAVDFEIASGGAYGGDEAPGATSYFHDLSLNGGPGPSRA